MSPVLTNIGGEPVKPGKPSRADDAQERATKAQEDIARAETNERIAKAEAAYENRTGRSQEHPSGLPFTKAFKSASWAVVSDPAATHWERVYELIKLCAWGKRSLFARKDDGYPMYQRDIADILKLDPRAVSKVVAYGQRRGYLEDQPKLLIPVIEPQLVELPPGGTEEWKAWKGEYDLAHSTDFQAYVVAKASVREYNENRLRAYKLSRRAARKDRSLYRFADSGPDPAKLKPLSPFEESNIRGEQTKQAKKNGHDAWQQSDAREFLFNEIARMQQTFPKSSFAQPPINPENPEHQNLVSIILQKLGSNEEEHVIGFVVWVAAEFKGLGARRGDAYKRPGASRAPGTDSGPATLGLLVLWAGDYGRIAGGK